MTYRLPPEDRADLVRILGDEGADEAIIWIRLARGEKAPIGAPSYDPGAAQDEIIDPDEIAAWRTVAAVRKDLKELAKDSAGLADRLRDRALMLHLAAGAALAQISEQRGRAWQGRRPLPSFDDTIYELRDLKSRLSTLGKWAIAGSPKPKRGAPRDAKRHAFVQAIVHVVQTAGLPIRIGEDSDLVKVARIAFRCAGFEGDPRDLLRTLKESGELRTGGRRAAAPAQGPQGAN